MSEMNKNRDRRTEVAGPSAAVESVLGWRKAVKGAPWTGTVVMV